jgi:hypothetical protein
MLGIRRRVGFVLNLTGRRLRLDPFTMSLRDCGHDYQNGD